MWFLFSRRLDEKLFKHEPVILRTKSKDEDWAQIFVKTLVE